jgi:hypothetical protein
MHKFNFVEVTLSCDHSIDPRFSPHYVGLEEYSGGGARKLSGDGYLAQALQQRHFPE